MDWFEKVQDECLEPPRDIVDDNVAVSVDWKPAAD